MGLAFILAIFAIVGAIKWHSFDDAQEQINSLRQVVRTDTECSMLDSAQLALDMGQPGDAHHQLERLNTYIKENR